VGITVGAGASGTMSGVGQAKRKAEVRASRPPGEIEARLAGQLRFLQRSADAFDAGDDGEAPRMAACARIVCHDGRWEGLLSQLGLKPAVRFLTTADDVVVEERLPNGGIRRRANLLKSSLVAIESDFIGGAPGLRAPLGGDTGTHTFVPFRYWWERQPC
jgi:hypothetical protein